MSLELDSVISILQSHIADGTLIQALAKDLIAAEREAKEAKEPTTKATPKRLVVLVRGDAALAKAVAGGAWVVSVPGTESPETTTYSGDSLLSRIKRAVTAANEAPTRGRRRGKPTRIKTFAEAMRWLRPKALKQTESTLAIRTKEPVEVVVVTAEDV